MIDNEYIYIIVPFTTMILAQFIKFLVESVNENKLVFKRLFIGASGMPSTHTSTSFSLTFLLLVKEGLASPLFAIAIVFSGIVAYDAMGLRLQSEKQAAAINMIMDELPLNKKASKFAKLKEALGHEPLEVMVGVMLALTVNIIYILI